MSGSVRRMTRTVLHGGMVFDGSGSPAASADVLIEGGKIVEVASQLDGDEGVDVTGKWVLPGFFDCHTHVMFGPDLMDVARRVNTPFSTRFYEAAQNLEATLRKGITTVRDAAGADLGVKTAVERGLIRGPRMQISIATDQPDRRARRRLDAVRRRSRLWSASTRECRGPSSTAPRRCASKVRELIRDRRRRDQGRDHPAACSRRGTIRGTRTSATTSSRCSWPRQLRRASSSWPTPRRTEGIKARVPRRHPLDRARHLPRRRGHPDDARPRHVARADAVAPRVSSPRPMPASPSPRRSIEKARDGDRGAQRRRSAGRSRPV